VSRASRGSGRSVCFSLSGSDRCNPPASRLRTPDHDESDFSPTPGGVAESTNGHPWFSGSRCVGQ
jgi:hypothetical protein